MIPMLATIIENLDLEGTNLYLYIFMILFIFITIVAGLVFGKIGLLASLGLIVGFLFFWTWVVEG